MAEPLTFTNEQVRGKRQLTLSELRFIQIATASGMGKDEAWELMKSGAYVDHPLNAQKPVEE